MKALLFSFVVAVTVVACNTSNKSDSDQKTTTIQPEEVEAVDMHTSFNSLDWAGTYKGVLPCADCEGIETVIRLFNDNTYNLQLKYLGKSKDPIKKVGVFQWDTDGSTVTLSGLKNEPKRYKVGENKLIQLNKDGTTITGDDAETYFLEKE